MAKQKLPIVQREGTATSCIRRVCFSAEAGARHRLRGGGKGCIRRRGGEGGSEGEGGGGVRLGPPLLGSPCDPAVGGPKIFKLKSSWRRRRRSKFLAVSLKYWKGRWGGRGGSRGGNPLLLRCTAVLIHHWWRATKRKKERERDSRGRGRNGRKRGGGRGREEEMEGGRQRGRGRGKYGERMCIGGHGGRRCTASMRQHSTLTGLRVPWHCAIKSITSSLITGNPHR